MSLPINLPSEAYVDAEYAAREVTDSNADEYGRAGMFVGARWGAVAELRLALADVETVHGADDPVAERIRTRIEALSDSGIRDHWTRGVVDHDSIDALRAAWQAAKTLDPAIGYPLAELIRELASTAAGGWGSASWALRDRAREMAAAVVRAADAP